MEQGWKLLAMGCSVWMLILAMSLAMGYERDAGEAVRQLPVEIFAGKD